MLYEDSNQLENGQLLGRAIKVATPVMGFTGWAVACIPSSTDFKARFQGPDLFKGHTLLELFYVVKVYSFWYGPKNVMPEYILVEAKFCEAYHMAAGV